MKSRRHVWILLSVCVAVAFSAFGFGDSASARTDAAAPWTATFDDESGDGANAPDITKVAISGDESSGTVKVAVSATGYEPATPDGLTRGIAVWLNVDKNDATGSPMGNEYSLQFFNDPADPAHWWNISRWDGNSWRLAALTRTMGFTRSSGLLIWTFALSDIGGASKFLAYLVASTEDAGGNVTDRDLAPDVGRYLFEVSGPSLVKTEFVTPEIGRPVTAPATVKAGKRVTVSFRVTRSDGATRVPMESGTLICNPSILGKVIPHSESFARGIARLSFLVPKTAKGKTLRVKMTVKAPSYWGDQATFFDLANEYWGIMGTWYSGQSAGVVATFAVR